MACSRLFYSFKPFLLLFWCLLAVAGYEVPVIDTDSSRQVCSGMWGSKSTFINVTFNDMSQGQLAMVVYEWKDYTYLGKSTSKNDVSSPKTYICTSKVVRAGLCSTDDLGRFILDIPPGRTINDTSFWSATVTFPRKNDNVTARTLRPVPIVSVANNSAPPATNINPSPSGTLLYQEPIQYLVRGTGYYCVAIVPVTVLEPAPERAPTDVPFHPSYKGVVLFQNTFKGKLPATEYPKVNFYFVMLLTSFFFAGVWGWLCFKHQHELLPIQYYLSSLVVLFVIEMVATWGYYRYLNVHSKGTSSTVFLFVVAVLDAGRNALSFFMLLVVSLGLSVVRESLGRTMLKCQALAVAHFVFGVLYAVGIVELEFESTSAFILLLFVVPLAFTLSGFLLWILYALSGTITQLRARKQRYKLKMFQRLRRILLVAVAIIFFFFVVSSFTFSGRLAEDYAARSWRYRWWLLDGWLVLLYFAGFASTTYLWRPSPNNRRLAMSDEIAQDEEDAEDYDMEALENRTRLQDDDDNATLVDRRGPATVSRDDVVFEIGDEEGGSDGEDPPSKKRQNGRTSLENNNNNQGELEGLMRQRS